MTSEAVPASEYRVEFSIKRRRDGEDEFTEVGFGSSGAWEGIAQAGYMASCAIETREWETSPGMPEPSDA